MLLFVSALLLSGCARPAPDFRSADRLIDASIARQEIPGAVLIVGHQGHVVYERAYGDRAIVPAPEPMTVDTIFDMASLTKPLVTALAAGQLIEQKKLVLDTPAASYWPAFGARGKQAVTVRELLTHTSGLPPDFNLTQPWPSSEPGKQHAFDLACDTPPMNAPGTVFRYSDINFIVLQALIERITGQTLDAYAQAHIFTPLGLEHTRYLPSADWLQRIAPTEYDLDGGPHSHGTMLRGMVHDPTARRMGGVAGHAGLFMSAPDLAVYAQALLDQLAGRPSAFPLGRATLQLMTTPQQPSAVRAERGLGWDIDSPYSRPRGDIFPIGSFGHTGFTGTSIWIDPASQTYVILLTNRVHPHAVSNVTPLRRDVATVVAKALGVAPTAVRQSNH